MSLKHLEHEGNEDFLEDEFPSRAKHADIVDKLKKQQKTEEEILIERQKAYMSVSNPALWDSF